MSLPSNGLDVVPTKFYLNILSYSCVKINTALVLINANKDDRFIQGYIPFEVELYDCSV